MQQIAPVGDHLTYLQRQLKRKAMTTYFDNRGVRRLSLLCDFIARVANNDHDDVNDTDNENAMRQTIFVEKLF